MFPSDNDPAPRIPSVCHSPEAEYHLHPCDEAAPHSTLAVHKQPQTHTAGFCYPCDAMLARVFATVRLSVCHMAVLCLAERKQDREMYTI